MTAFRNVVIVAWFMAALPNSWAIDAPKPPASSAALSAEIDRYIEARLKTDGIAPAAMADDAEFMRRIYLDLAGRIPTVAQVRRFLDDRTPDKRQRLIDDLLSGPTYAQHFANVWRAGWLADTPAAAQNPGLGTAFETTLRQQLTENLRYDQMVRSLLAPSGNRTFYVANEEKPENLAAATTRLFLGVKMECAQCHRHPFAPWTREQFWSTAAFFNVSQPRQRNRQAARPSSPLREIKIPGTDKVVRARFLDDTEVPMVEGADPRVQLAQWVTAAENPWFARAAVNRVWAHFFGIGLVDPVDELGEQNPPSHPELLDELAKEFVAQQFDLKSLIRAIVNSQAYQRSSCVTDTAQEDPRLFARMALKGMSVEQLFDSLANATGYQEKNQSPNRPGARAEFLNKFANPAGQRAEFQLSILQALALMNGRITADVTDLERSETLAAVIDAPFLDTARRIETLYLAVLTRPPRPEETARLVQYVDGEPEARRGRALADVFWALLNSGEFILNH